MYVAPSTLGPTRLQYMHKMYLDDMYVDLKLQPMYIMYVGCGYVLIGT